jgi:hypothetical protein
LGAVIDGASVRLGGRMRMQISSLRALRCSGRQLDGYKPYPGLHVKGDLTMRGKIDDLSGGVEHGCLVPGFHSQAQEGILVCRANLGVPAVGRNFGARRA